MNNWYIVDDNNNNTVRGPYKHKETARAVRNELESFYPERDWNLWVVEKHE